MHRYLLAATEVMLAALRGEPDAARALDALGPPDVDSEPELLGMVDHARAWVAFVQGRLEDAQRLATAAGELVRGADQHRALALAARAALWRGDAEAASSAIERLAALRFDGRTVDATEFDPSRGCRSPRRTAGGAGPVRGRRGSVVLAAAAAPTRAVPHRATPAAAGRA